MKMISLTCESCGGTMEVDPAKESIVCPYCGNKVLIQKTDYARMEYERLSARARVEEEAEKRKRRAQRKPKLILLGILLIFALIGVGSAVIQSGDELRSVFHPVEADPFENVTVRFLGDNGDGRAEVENRNQGDLRSISFTVSPDRKLYNGDTVTVKAGSVSGYRFVPEKKTFTVSGLIERVRSLSAVNDTDLEKIHDNTQRLIREEWDEILATGRAVSYTVEPYRTYFFVENDPDDYPWNHLYDAYEVTVQKASGEEMTVYEACKYSEMQIGADGTLTVQYGDLQGYNMGYFYGFTPTSSFSGWLDAAEMEADLRSVRSDCTLVE